MYESHGFNASCLLKFNLITFQANPRFEEELGAIKKKSHCGIPEDIKSHVDSRYRLHRVTAISKVNLTDFLTNPLHLDRDGLFVFPFSQAEFFSSTRQSIITPSCGIIDVQGPANLI